MRIIAGMARGHKLQTLEGEETRPTLERVKEGIFSSVQFVVPGAKVLDLFAGSGQMGLEALSREAAFAVFVDRNPAAVQVVTQNARDCGLYKQSRIVNMTAESFLAGNKEAFDIVFLDPPYRYGTLQALLPAVAAHTAPGGLVLCESEPEAELPLQVEGLTQVKQYRYGTVKVTKYQKAEE